MLVSFVGIFDAYVAVTVATVVVSLLLVFLFNVTVYVFAEQVQLVPLQLADVPVLVPPDVLYPVEHVPPQVLLLTDVVQFVQLHADHWAYNVVLLVLFHVLALANADV